MISGIGADIVELERIRHYAAKKYFLDRVFTKKEIRYAMSKKNLAHLGTAFAAKEAVFKALGGRLFEPKEIEITRNRKGKPEARLSGGLKKLLKNRRILLSMSSTKNFSVALAVIS